MSNIYKIRFDQKGFTSLAEMVLILGIISLLMSLAIVSFPRIQQSSKLSTTVDAFLSDLKGQQLKAMMGDGGGGLPDYYGIHFETNSYSLFRGATYSADPSPFVINLPSTIQSTNMFPDNQILFLKGDGEVSGCCNGAGFSVTFNETSVIIDKTITVNRLGAYTIK